MSRNWVCILSLFAIACSGESETRPAIQIPDGGLVVVSADSSLSEEPIIVKVEVRGQGRVFSQPAGIDCIEGSCLAEFPHGTVVTLDVAPSPGSSFTHWNQDCEQESLCQINDSTVLVASFHVVDNLQWMNDSALGQVVASQQGDSLLIANEELNTLSLRSAETGLELWTVEIPQLEGVEAMAEVAGQGLLLVGQGQPQLGDELLGSGAGSLYAATYSMLDGQLLTMQVLADPQVPYILSDMEIARSGDIVISGYFSSRYPLDLSGDLPLRSWWNEAFGDTNNRESNEGFLAVYDSNGAQQWQHRFGGKGGQYVRNMALGPQGEVIVEVPNSNQSYAASDDYAGMTFLLDDVGFRFDNAASLFLKFDSAGQLAWLVEQPNHDWTVKRHIASLDMDVSEDGQVYVSGQVMGACSLSGLAVVNPGGADSTPFVAKLSGEDGQGVWSKVFATELGGKFFAMSLLGKDTLAFSARFFGNLVDSSIDEGQYFGGSFVGIYAQEDASHRWTHLLPDGASGEQAHVLSVTAAQHKTMILQGTSYGSLDIGQGNWTTDTRAFAFSLTY